MANKNDEMILVIPSAPFTSTKAADAREDEKAYTITTNYEASMCTPGVAQLRRRGDMEENEKFVQPIPYAVLYHVDDKILENAMFLEKDSPDYYESVYLLSYKRGTEGGETRLHNMYSVGFGGHINSADVVSAFSNYASNPGASIELECAARELREELGVDIKTSPDVVLDAGPGSMCTPYVFYDDSSKVSSRHICKALYFKVNDMDAIKAEEDCIKKLTWVPLKELCENMDNMESWSKIVVAYTKEIFDTAQRQKEESATYYRTCDIIRDIFKEDKDTYNKLIVEGDNEAIPEITRRVISNDKIVRKPNPKQFESIVTEIVARHRSAYREATRRANRLKKPQRLGGIIDYQ